MAIVRPEDWRPRGIEDLEPDAWRALRQHGSACVVAGPGAGKTEFLAQRAAFLLETGLCPTPFRILAISFKSDAADNLATRVRKRCPPELSHRFTSLTFDAFTKSLVDRFLTAIPSDWRPSRPYEMAFPNFRQVAGFLQNALVNTPNPWKPEVASLGASDFESHHVGAYRLPIARAVAQSGTELTIQRWWASQLATQPHSRMTFVSLNRLAELLLRASPHIQRALQLTYPFVFVDEFQDTTYAQYGFLLSAFLGANVAITAVGDDKQRIMTWAGARADAFERFEADFAAVRISLLFNFRSSPDLVRIQHVVARALDPNAATTVAQAARQVDGDVAQVWNSPSKAREAEHLGQWLANDMAARGRAPRDYAILVKQKSDDFEADLAEPLSRAGLRLRNESHALGRTTLQDLLTDTFAKIAVALLRLGSTRRAANSWQLASTALLEIRAIGDGDDGGEARTENELTTFVATLRADMANTPPSAAAAQAFADRVYAFLNLASIARTYVEYSTGELLAIMAEAFKLHLAASANGTPIWAAALDAFEGVGQVPLMTVHKSKGLEYDTIVFVGLDDQAWWAHRPGNPEGLATFFVALSRAKQRAIFAFCRERGQRQRVAELFQLLTDAGVPEIAI
ncbi:UvrD-helicase domain-containing protein [Burkholderia pseudomallei]|uniref:UvrD-helicase domain-containing protein n=1 Tax=Burkholderia pseudomallei TaxID=28450 RepID=UPI000E68EEE0|nr:ATP-dependent helicase [Burkholderia pseudomallei]RIV39307.1 ATP-dependent helicase [Burkholderia pseudomallei]RIV56641.1 ATP-dependent helicase [Burkholderia pseudomallei]